MGTSRTFVRVCFLGRWSRISAPREVRGEGGVRVYSEFPHCWLGPFFPFSVSLDLDLDLPSFVFVLAHFSSRSMDDSSLCGDSFYGAARRAVITYDGVDDDVEGRRREGRGGSGSKLYARRKIYVRLLVALGIYGLVVRR